MHPRRAFLFEHPAHLIAFGFGSGLMPKAPGTWGTLVGIPFYFVAFHLGGFPAALASAAALFGVGIWASSRAGRALGVADHGGIVIDEIAACVLVLTFTPTGIWWFASAFALFRLFDITKPWPIRHFDRTLKGGFGVMFDDFLAAIAAIAILRVLRSFL
ncbi:MAG: phosphatidylglycerophosphatase A [Usitatibacteraceae bacterium]